MANLPSLANWTGALAGTTPTSVVPYSQLQSFFSYQGTTDPTPSTVPPTTVGDSIGIFYFNTVGNSFWYLKSINAGVYTWVNLTQGGGSSLFTISATDPTSATVGVQGSAIYNTVDNKIWICIAVNTGTPTTYTWQSPSTSGSGNAVGRTNVIFPFNPQVAPISYVVSPSTIDNRIVVNMPLIGSTNTYSPATGDGLINGVTYIKSNPTLQTYGNSISFPTSLTAGEYLVNLYVNSPVFTIRVNSNIALAASNIALRVGIGKTQAITDTENPLDDGYVWIVFDKPSGTSDNFIPAVKQPVIIVTAVAGQTNQYDIAITGGEWIGSSYSNDRSFTGSLDEYCIFIGIVPLNSAILTIVSTTNFISGSALVDVTLNGVAGGGGGGGDLTGECTVVTTVDPGNNNFPIGSPYIVPLSQNTLAIPIPLNSMTNDFTYFAGSGYIGTTRYIRSTGQRTIYGDSMVFPTSLIAQKYNAYTSLKNINCTVRVTCATNPGTNWVSEFTICPKSVATGLLNPTGNGNAWNPFELPAGNDNDSLMLVAPTITVTPVAGQTNKYDLNISGGEWYMASLSATNGYTGSTTEFLSYLTIYNTDVIITAVENPTSYNSFSNGIFSLSINLNGVGGGGGGSTYVPTSPKGTISIIGAESNELDIAQQGATANQVLAWDAVNLKFAPKTIATTQTQSDYSIVDNTQPAFIRNKPIWSSGTASAPTATDGNIYIKYNRDATGIPIDMNFENNVAGTYSVNQSVADFVENLCFNLIRNISFTGIKGIDFNSNFGVDNNLGTNTAANATTVLYYINKGLINITLANVTGLQDAYFITRYYANQTIQYTSTAGTWQVNILSYNKINTDATIVAVLDNATNVYNQSITTLLALGGTATNSVITYTGSTVINNMFGSFGEYNNAITNNYLYFNSNGQIISNPLPIATDSVQGIANFTSSNGNLLISSGSVSLANAFNLLSLIISGTGSFLRLSGILSAPVLSTDATGNVIAGTLPIATSAVQGIASYSFSNGNLLISNGIVRLASDFALNSLTISGATSFLKLSNLLSTSVLGTDANGNIIAGTASPLPIASSSVLGGIKIGSGINIQADGTATVTGGGVLVKQLCDIITTTNINLTGLQTIQGVALTATSRVVVTGQTNQATNGIYNPNVNAWVRTSDANTIALLSSALVTANLGDNAGDTYFCTTGTTGTIGTTAITWIQSGNTDAYNIVNGGLDTGAGITKNTVNNQVVLALDENISLTGTFSASRVTMSSPLVRSVKVLGSDTSGQIISNNPNALTTFLGTDISNNFVSRAEYVKNYSKTTAISYTIFSDLILNLDAGGTGLVDLGTAPFTYSSGIFTYTGNIAARVTVDVVVSITATTTASAPNLYINYGSTAGTNKIKQVNSYFSTNLQNQQFSITHTFAVSPTTTDTNNKFAIYYRNSFSPSGLIAGNEFPFSAKITISGIN